MLWEEEEEEEEEDGLIQYGGSLLFVSWQFNTEWVS